jgi:hypothetical protein
MPIQYNEIANVALYNQNNGALWGSYESLCESTSVGVLSEGELLSATNAWEPTSFVGMLWAPGKSRSCTIFPNDAL